MCISDFLALSVGVAHLRSIFISLWIPFHTQYPKVCQNWILNLAILFDFFFPFTFVSRIVLVSS